jgi:hypothetical protein
MLVSGLVAGFVLGVATGGHLRSLQTLDLKFWPGLIAGVVARGAAPFLGGLALLTSLAGLVLVSAVAVVNRSLPGAGLIALGSTLNAIVTFLNAGMPVDPAALVVSGKPAPSDGLHVLIGSGTQLPFLADVLLVPVINNIYSLGDVLLAIGGFWMTFRLLKRS